MKTRKLNIPIAATLLSCFVANGQTSDSSTITTSDGKTYQNVEVLRADPDGIIVSYQPEKPGIGMAKLKFSNLPDSVRTKYSYDTEKSAAFATSQAQATAQWRAQQASTEEYYARYRALAELNRSLGGDAVTSYSISLSADGKLAAQGFTGSY